MITATPDYDAMAAKLNGAALNGVAHVAPVAPVADPMAGEPMDGTALLGEVHDFLADFIAYPGVHAQVAHTLWIAHTHLMDAWESTPRLAFLSPEPGSGKTRALEVSELLVPRPIEAINATPAYLFRKVADKEGLPTILFDEIDTVFGPRAKENEEIRGILNAGHRRGAMAGRCVVRGRTVETEELPAYCAVALAGLGSLPDTILSRSIIIRMRRRSQDERIEPYRRRVHRERGHQIRDNLAAWADTVRTQLSGTWPEMPPGIADRDADMWEPLIAVAEAAGGQWPALARVAAVAFVADSKAANPSLGVRLLSDLRQVFGPHEALSTRLILEALMVLEESPWADLKGKPLDSRKLAYYLRPYGVQSENIRERTTIAKGYKRESLHDPWMRYLGPATNGCATAATQATEVRT